MNDEPRRASARIATALVSARVPNLGLIPLGTVPAFVAVLARSAALPRSARRSLGLALLAVISGGFMAAFIDRRQGIGDWTTETMFIGLWILSIPLLASAIFLAWTTSNARRLLVVAMLIGTASNALYFPLDVNPWKQAIGYSCSVLLLLWAHSAHLVAQSAVLIALFSLGLYFDTRSLALVAALALGSVAMSRRRRTGVAGALRVAMAGACFLGVLVLALESGWLGSEQRDLYEEQTRSAGNLITGARVESVITGGLARERPIGYGLGVQVAPVLQVRMIDRVRLEGGDYTNGYFTQSVLGQRADLHSTMSNLWFHGGPVGLLMALAIGWWLALALASLSRIPRAWQAVCAFLLWMGLWDLFFSPMQQSDRLSLALGCAWVVIAWSRKDLDDSTVRDTTTIGRHPSV